MEQNKLSRFKRILIIVFLAYVFCWINCSGVSNPNNDNENNKYIDIEPDTVLFEDPNGVLYEQLLTEINMYIGSQAPGSHEDLGKYILDAGIENDIDICFMMAQTQLETNFGTMGAGRQSSRRSLFGVYGRRYDNYEHAVYDYCRILKKYYLINGKTEAHMMQNYVARGGGRYAGNPNYEDELRQTYRHITKRTNIKQLQDALIENMNKT